MPSVVSGSVRPVSQKAGRQTSQSKGKMQKEMMRTTTSRQSSQRTMIKTPLKLSQKSESSSKGQVKKSSKMPSTIRTRSIDSRTPSMSKSSSTSKSAKSTGIIPAGALVGKRSTSKSIPKNTLKSTVSQDMKKKTMTSAMRGSKKIAAPVSKDKVKKNKQMLVKKQAKNIPVKPTVAGARRIAAVKPTKKAGKVQRVGRKAQVFRGICMRTSGGLVRSDLIRNKRGCIVSKKKSELGKKNLWMQAVSEARRDFGYSSFEPIKKGTAFYTRIQQLYALKTGRELPEPVAKIQKASKKRDASQVRSKSKSKSN